MNHLNLETHPPERVTSALENLVWRVQRSMVMVKNGPQGVGAGIIWRANGVILTNNHVIQRQRPSIALPDGSQLPAAVLDRDPEIDLALLRVEARDLPAAMIADARELRVGELVIAVGHPWGQPGVVTMGVVSGLGSAQTGGPRKTVPIIRSDVRLAPGNSGGPLVNARGAVVGINTMIVGGDQGVAIPSHVATAFVEEALDRQVFLGVGVQAVPLPDQRIPQLAMAQEAGLLVVDVDPAGPATRAGVIPGDILLRLGGVPLDHPRALLRALTARTPGERVSLGVLRGGQWQQVEIELDPREQQM